MCAVHVKTENNVTQVSFCFILTAK